MVDHHGYYDAYHGWVPETWYDTPHPIHPLHGRGPVPGVAHSAEPWTTVEEHVVAHHEPWEGPWHGEAWHGDYMSDHHIWDEYHPDDPYVAKARASLEKSKQKQAPKVQEKSAAKQPVKAAQKKKTGNDEDNYESYYTY